MSRLPDLDDFLEDHEPTIEEVLLLLKEVVKEMAEERAQGEQK